ncbi:hypothetical protein GCM10028784_31690 [Myceligenerans cantabricum]
MPLFEVDATRPFLVQGSGGGPGSEPGVHTSAHRVVESHIDGLLGEQVFPVAQGTGPDEPHLLALDASGLPVVVELVGDLDKSTLTLALDHAGAAGRLTRGELASRYHGGQHNFAHDVADFYDTVPITQSSSSKSGGGARLIIICQNAPQEILNAVDFLRQPTMPVEVLKMDVVKSDDGRRFLDVSPLVIHLPPGLPSPRQVNRGGSISRGGEPEHVTPENVASAPMFTSQSADSNSFAEGVKVGYALTGKMPVVAHESRAGGARNPAPASADRPPRAEPQPADGRAGNAARGLRRSLSRGGEQPPATEAATGSGSDRALPQSRSARRAIAEREASTQASGPTPAPLSTERPGPSAERPGQAGGRSAAAPMPGRSATPSGEATAPHPSPEPSHPSSDTVPRVQKPAQTPVRRRSRTDRFASAPDGQPGAPQTPAAGDPPPAFADHTPTSVRGSFTDHAPVPLPPERSAGVAPGPGPAPAEELWQPPTARQDSGFAAYAAPEEPSVLSAPSEPSVFRGAADPSAFSAPSERAGFPDTSAPSTFPGRADSAPSAYPGGSGPTPFPEPADPPAQESMFSAMSLHEGHPSGSFGPVESVPFEPPVIDSQAWPENEAWGDGQGAGYTQDPAYAGYTQDPAYAVAQQPDAVYDWSADPSFGAPQPGGPAQADYGMPGAQPAFPGQAPEAQVPPVPTDESIRSNTPGLFDEEEDPDLEALARSFGAPTRIVWSRPRRNQHYEGVLHPNGVIELADGGQYRHPDTAATAASGSYTADGWTVWRVGEQGPSLTEAFQQRFV